MKYLLIIVALMANLSVYSQTDRASIREGNKLYDLGSKDTTKYNLAKQNYQKALDKNSNSVEGNFNLGDVYYQQHKFDSAASKFNAAAGMTTDKSLISKAYHNMGNALLQDKKYDESIEAFKNSLKNNPKDEDTKYNLAYAQSMLQKQQQQKKDDKDKKDDKKQDKKDQQKKDEKKDDKKDQQKQQQKKDDKDKKDDKQQQPKEQKKMSKEDAERMLQALNNQEKDLQKKLGKKVPASGVIIDKDW